MFSIKQISITTIGTMAIGLGSVAPVNAASLYQVTGLDFTPADINNSSQIVGGRYLWQNGNTTDLTTLPGADDASFLGVTATAINNNGVIVGNGFETEVSFNGFISNGSTISSLANFYNCTENCVYGSVTDINDSGSLALVFYGSYPTSVILNSNGTGTSLEPNNAYINSINEQGQVVGNVSYAGGNSYGIFSDNEAQVTNLLPEAQIEPSTSFLRLAMSNANDIDDNGNIVGSGLVSTIASYQNTDQEATLWEDPTQPGVSLGTLGGEDSVAFGINNSQQIVGVSTLLDGSTEHAFLWENGDLIDLNSLIDPESGWLLTSAFEINDSGDIIGIGLYNGVQRGFYAQAVPEPSSVLGILGLGAFGLSNWLKRQQRKN